MDVMGVMGSGRDAARACAPRLALFPQAQSQPSAAEAYQLPKLPPELHILHPSYTKATPKPRPSLSRLFDAWAEGQRSGPAG